MAWQIVIAWITISILTGLIIGEIIRHADSIKPEEDR